MLNGVSPRLYQETILATATLKNTLVVLPTGMGKTIIAVMLAAHRLGAHKGSKVLLLSPTKPLAEQHYKTFSRLLDISKDSLRLFTGNVAPAKRKELWKESTIIFSTPQGLENDIINKSITLEDVSLIIFDEAHRAVGDYSYVFLAKEYQKQASWPRILALTASPGEKTETILEVCQNLGIEDVEIRTGDDPDVKPYVQDLDIGWEYVDLPKEFLEVRKLLDDCSKKKLAEIKSFGYINSIELTKGDLISLQKHFFAEMATGEKDPEKLRSISLLAESLKIQHALELLETQGLSQLLNYLERLEDEAKTSKVKAVKNLVADINFREALIKTRRLSDEGFVHPKLPKVLSIAKEIKSKGKDAKMIVFTQFRETGSGIADAFEKEGITAKVFVGQAKKGASGMSQKIQSQTLDAFRNGEFTALIATSVAEEGLDIPAVDYVIFYEPVPSAIRSIQRRGRTGRQESGHVVVLLSRGTRDEAYRWSAHHKEKRMHRLLRDLKKKLVLQSKPIPAQSQNTLSSYTKSEVSSQKPVVFADFREKGSEVIKSLLDLDVDLRLKQLNVGDFAVSERVVVEYKTVEDFVNSIIDGRLIPQLKELKRNYWRPMIIVEGRQDIYEVRRLHPNSIRGMIATITAGFNIPIIMTKTGAETAGMIEAIAKREQEWANDAWSPHGERKAQSTKEAQEYIISAFPGVGPTLSKPILRRFKTLKNFMNAKEDELKEVENIGDMKAKNIRKLIDEEYKE